jgi:hypothetical protein
MERRLRGHSAIKRELLEEDRCAMQPFVPRQL